MGSEAGRTGGGRGGGSWKIWCWVEMLLCLYLWPRRWPMFWEKHCVSELVSAVESGMCARSNGPTYRLDWRRGNDLGLEVEWVRGAFASTTGRRLAIVRHTGQSEEG